MTSSVSSGVKRVVVQAFILFHLFVLIVWNASWHIWYYAFDEKIPLVRPIGRYLHCVGLSQYWNMFAPEPGFNNIYMEIRITYDDRLERHLALGHLSQLDQWDRLLQARFRRVMEAVWHPPVARRYYPQVARWALWRAGLESTRTPVSVEIWRWWLPIPRPPAGLKRPPVTRWSRDVVYRQVLTQDAAP